MNGGMTLQRVVVTGMGTVNPLGHSVAETVATMDAGKVGIQPITKFDAEKTGITVAGEVKDFKPEERMSKRLSKRMDLFTQYGLYGALILESLEHAQKRGAKILGEVVGYGATSDAYHMTAPDPSGSQAARAMQLAVEEAGIKPSEVGYINAHGTATKANDAMESKAIHDLFGDDVLVSSTKALTGHLLGAAGAIEAIMTLSALQSGRLPMNVVDAAQDEDCPVTLVNRDNRDTSFDYALSNSFGFGGHNAVLAFKRW